MKSVIVSAVRTPTGKFLGASRRSPRRSSARWSCARPCRAPASIRPLVDECIMGNVIQAGERPEPGAPGRAQRRADRPRRRDDDQQGLRLRPQGGDARGPGHRAPATSSAVAGGMESMSNAPVPAAAGARRVAHGQRAARRLADSRRPVVHVRALPHGHVGRGRRRAVRRRPRRAGRVRRASHRKAADASRARAGSPTRSCRSPSPQEERAAARSSIATSRCARTRPPKRSPH